MDKKLLQKEFKAILSRLIIKSKKFCEIACVPDGLLDIMLIYNRAGFIPDDLKYSNKISYDYDYFAFVKSTKSLIAIRHLLNYKELMFSEDSVMIIRSIFENHIMSRYVRENIDDKAKEKEIIDNFILAPLGVSFDYFINTGRKGVFSKDAEKVGEIKNPSSVIMGKEKDYYRTFYNYLCQYTHCNYGAISNYISNGELTIYGENDSLLTYLFAIFAFTKVYEGVVTVNGEDLVDTKTMKSFYDLAYDSLELQSKVIDFLICYYEKEPKNNIDIVIEKYMGEGEFSNSNKKIARMIGLMKDSIFDDEIGSLDKSRFKDGRFTRIYQEW